MNVHLTTPRLILRDFLDEDTEGLFEMDSNPLVHTYLGERPILTLAQARADVDYVRRQYHELGVGRLTVLERDSGRLMGWSGLKRVQDEVDGLSDFLDLGYRFAPSHWGKGYATESAWASLQLGFEGMKAGEIFATVDVRHHASIRVLEKVGLIRQKEVHYYGRPHYLYRIGREEWEKEGRRIVESGL